MVVPGWLSWLRRRLPSGNGARRRRGAPLRRFVPQVWQLEDRCLLSGTWGSTWGAEDRVQTKHVLTAPPPPPTDPEVPKGSNTPLSAIFWNGGAPLNPPRKDGSGGVPGINAAPTLKTITITNTTGQTIYPILRDANTGQDPHNTNRKNPENYYDPQDFHNQEYRAYIGYVQGGKEYVGLPAHATITIRVPLVFWDAENTYIATDGKDLFPADPINNSNPFRYDPSSSRGVSLSTDKNSWVTNFSGNGAQPAGLVMFYHATQPLTPSLDAPAQLTEFTIRDPYLNTGGAAPGVGWLTDDAQTSVLFNYDVSYVDNLTSSIAMEAAQVPIPIALNPNPPAEDFGWAGSKLIYGTPQQAGTMQNLISDFINNTGPASIGDYFGPKAEGWPSYINPNGVLKVPGGANIFANSPLNGQLSSYTTYGLNNQFMLSSGGTAPIMAQGAGGLVTSLDQTVYPLIFTSAAQRAQFFNSLKLMDPNPTTDPQTVNVYFLYAGQQTNGPVVGTVADYSNPSNPNATPTLTVKLNGPLTKTGPIGFVLQRPAGDYAATAIQNLWYSWAQYYVNQFASFVPPAPATGSIRANTNVLTLDSTPPSLAVGMTVSGSAGSGIDPAPNTKVSILGITKDGVKSIDVTHGGSGYTSKPFVNITGGGGSGATAVAVLSGDTITGVTVIDAGSGYTSPPTISFSGGGGTGADAKASVGTLLYLSQLSPGGSGTYTFGAPQALPFANADGIKSIVVTNQGSHYTSEPDVMFSGGGGSGAVAKAILSKDGQITGVAIINAGSGYTSAPMIQFIGGGGRDAAATATIGTSVTTFPLTFTADQQQTALRFAGSVYEAMAAEAGILIYPTKSPLLPPAMSLVYTTIGCDTADLPNANGGGSLVGGQVRDLIKSILRGVYDFTQVPESQWYPNPATWQGGQHFNVYNLDPYVWFVHRVLGLSGYGFSVDDDTSDVSAAASNYTPVAQQVHPNNLDFFFSGLSDPTNKNALNNKLEWFPSVNYGTVNDTGIISNPTDGPYAGKTIITMTTETKYWQIANPDPTAGQIGAYVSGPGVPPGTVVAGQGDTKALILILSNHATDSAGKAVPLTFTGKPPANPILDSGFEVPFLNQKPPANHQPNPPGSPWTFNQSSGIAGNGSSLTALNGPAPEGTQVGYLQGLGTISQMVTLQAGTYTLSFDAAQRQNGAMADHQTIAIMVDSPSNVVGEITPSGANYTAYSVTFTVAAGPHTIILAGMAAGGGDPTAFIDAVTLTVKLQ
jgi:hypothetical protein